MNVRRLLAATALVALAISCGAPPRQALADEPFELATGDGYRGNWYSNQKTGDEYVDKYSGGMPPIRSRICQSPSCCPLVTTRSVRA